MAERLKQDFYAVSASIVATAFGYMGFNADGSILKWTGLAAMCVFAMAATLNIDRTKALTQSIKSHRARTPVDTAPEEIAVAQ